MAYLEVFIDGFAYFSLFPYIIYDHLKCVSRLHATLYKQQYNKTKALLLISCSCVTKSTREYKNTRISFGFSMTHK